MRCAIFTILTSYRLSQLDLQFQQLLDAEASWSTSLSPVKDLYLRFFAAITQQIRNVVCGSCGCIDHRPDSYEHVPISYDSLYLLTVPMVVNILFDFSCGIDLLDKQHILLDEDGITFDGQNVILCKSCYSDLQHKCRLVQSLSNFQWVGLVSKELQDLI